MSEKKQHAFLALYEPVHADFERFCRARAYGQMDDEDLLNETLLIAYQKFDTLKSEKAFLAFLLGISVRVLANHNKKRIKEQAIENDRAQQIPDHVATDHDAEVFFLYQALDKLPEAQKEALILFEISGFSIREIAALQKASESAIKKRLERGRIQLAHILSDQPKPSTRKELHRG